MNLDDFLYKPNCFEMIISGAGTLSGNERRDRIIKIAKKNIWLAAKCVNTCINVDDTLIDWLIKRAHLIYSGFHDIYAIAAMLELREYGELSVMLDLLTKNKLYNNVHKEVWLLLQNDERSMSKAFSVFSQLIDKELAANLFRCLSELGYEMNSDAYNAVLANIKDPQEIKMLIEKMKISGVEADAVTYFHLISKAGSFEEALEYFENFKATVDFQNEEDLVSGTYNTMIRIARNIQDILDLKNDYLFHCPELERQQSITVSYYVRSIEVSSSYEEAKNYFDEYREKQIPQYYAERLSKKKKNLSSKQKRAIINTITSFVRRIECENLCFEEAMEIMSWISKLYSDFHKKQIKDSIDHISSFISHMITSLNDFTKGNNLIHELIDIGLWVNMSCYIELLLHAKTKEDVDYVIEHLNITAIKPQNALKVIQSCDNTVFEYVLEQFQKNDYPFNIIHYNAIIKRDSYDEAFKIIKQMIDMDMKPDKFTIQPMLRKWNNIKELSKVIQLASMYSICADDRSAQAIARQANINHLTAELIDFSIESRENTNDIFDESWLNAVLDAGNILMRQIC